MISVLEQKACKCVCTLACSLPHRHSNKMLSPVLAREFLSVSSVLLSFCGNTSPSLKLTLSFWVNYYIRKTADENLSLHTWPSHLTELDFVELVVSLTAHLSSGLSDFLAPGLFSVSVFCLSCLFITVSLPLSSFTLSWTLSPTPLDLTSLALVTF